MPYEIHFVARMWDATESDEHKKLVQRAVQLLSDIEEVCGKADAEIEDYSLGWFGDESEPKEWTISMEDGLRHIQEATLELGADGPVPDDGWVPGDESIVTELMDAEGFEEDEARAILAEIRSREKERADA